MITVKYFILSILNFVMWLMGMLLAPVLPMFRIMREGPVNNNNERTVEPFLPDWLYWFSTNEDNSLWGDEGWRTKHCPLYWNTYWGMVKWLWRNSACGFAWSVLAHEVSSDETFTVTDSGYGFNIDKSKPNDGWFKVLSSKGYWHYRSVTILGSVRVSVETGWGLDTFVKNPDTRLAHPRATFIMWIPLLRWNK